MIDVTIHFRALGIDRRTMPAVPSTRSYIRHAGRLWLVDNVLFDAGVHVYALQVSAGLAAEIEAMWAAWGESTAAAGDDCPGKK